jgi:5-methylcytosine-specific restriction endonuclease McrA
MTDQTLLRAGPVRDEPAEIAGYGPVPAEIARDLITNPSQSVPRWVRRLYVEPTGGELVAVESRRRRFTAGQARTVRLRDQICRTPWCNAPIRHIDHVRSYAAGGRTSVANAEGLCEACNYAKEALGWTTRTEPGSDIVITTPTGHEYRSRAPSLPGTNGDSRVEKVLADIVYLHRSHHAAA